MLRIAFLANFSNNSHLDSKSLYVNEAASVIRSK